MGVVYKAEDIKLERTVALKFLAQHLLDDDEAKQRFLREAKAAAALDHPNICTVYEIGEADGKTFISMAFLEGEPLEDRIAQGPLSLKDALDIARQVAEGLQAAHTKGVFHRDIKPANIIVSPEGRATIMDFGLARLTEASRLTKVDTAMGTVAYMSPEQAQGMEVDSRTDLWSLGCVVYEMVSGQRPFQGQYDQALLYEIVHEEPEALTGLRTGVPIELELLTAKCLAKDAADRYQSANETAVDLRTLSEKLKSGRSTILQTARPTEIVPAAVGQTLDPAQDLSPSAVVIERKTLRTVQAVAAVATLALIVLGSHYVSQGPSDDPQKIVRRFSFSAEGGRRASISPDGRFIALTVETDNDASVWLRPIDSETVRNIAGTNGVRANRAPAWSPNSRSIVFATHEELRRVSVDGSEATVLCQLPGPDFGGASWSPDGARVVFISGDRIWDVSSRGGEPTSLVQSDPGVVLYTPSFALTDDSSQVLFYRAGNRIHSLDLETGESRDVVEGTVPVYAPSGHLLYRRSGGLWATPFSIETTAPTGEAFPISESGQWLSVTRDGALLYADYEGARQRLTVRDRSGATLRTVGQRNANGWPPTVSPDGRLISISLGGNIWVFDLARDVATRLTSSSDNEALPSWGPSGGELSYVALGANQLLSRLADGSGEASVLLEGAGGNFDWSPDNRYLVYTATVGAGQQGIWYRGRGLNGDLSDPVTFLESSDNVNMPQFSPDGRYLAYVSGESGRDEVYVRPFPDGPGRWRVSVNGGTTPRWSQDGKEVFYVEETTLLATPIFTTSGFRVGLPETLFESAQLRPIFSWMYDVCPDGQRFVTRELEGDDVPQAKFCLVENWYEEFRDREQ